MIKDPYGTTKRNLFTDSTMSEMLNEMAPKHPHTSGHLGSVKLALAMARQLMVHISRMYKAQKKISSPCSPGIKYV